ncbi:hypothetical protein LY76DRAFT_91412 [Colletotrichum caudatum]|nr:hypothetical protein LY76DRAFT_91412 [Colletotrichum caudatum]
MQPRGTACQLEPTNASPGRQLSRAGSVRVLRAAAERGRRKGASLHPHPLPPALPTEEPGTELRLPSAVQSWLYGICGWAKQYFIAQRHADVLLRFLLEGGQVVLPHSRPAKVARGGRGGTECRKPLLLAEKEPARPPDSRGIGFCLRPHSSMGWIPSPLPIQAHAAASLLAAH